MRKRLNCLVPGFILLLLFGQLATSRRYAKPMKCATVRSIQRLDCYPEAFATEAKCLSRGCCWRQPDLLEHEVAPPTCYFPLNYPVYFLHSRNDTARGMTLALQKPHPENVYSEEFKNALLEVRYETDTRLRLRFTDPTQSRWEPPVPISPAADHLNQPQYQVTVANNPLGVRISRGNKTLIEFSDYLTTALILSDQFLQVTFRIHAHHGYGLGERRVPSPLSLHKWDRAGMWNRDMPPTEDVNLYGTQNFFLGVDEQGEAFGLFLLNSNAQEVAVQPLPALTYRTTGGILDFFLFTGPTPSQVVSQYVELIGRPRLPPYWSLGFHLCRYGYRNTAHVEEVLERNRAAGIPLDVQWLDIDYMDEQKDWTYDRVNFANLSQFVKRTLHDNYRMQNVIIVDPAINIIQGYRPYEDGLRMGIFVNDSRTGKPIIGQVWPGDTLFPDFSHPLVEQWWTGHASEFFQEVPFDGLWIDMNEPSNFVDGSKTGCIEDSLLDNPPYVPQIIGGTLYSKTLCPSAQHYNNTHYNLHNLYSYMEARVTSNTLDSLRPGKRQFLLSRSTFAGSGVYTFHWTGDNFSSWNDLLASIAQMINFNIFGIPMVGADICGFNGQATEELCLRWSQLGAFYPFSRNHNAINSRPQDPAAYSPETTKAIRDVIRFRYFMLPYWYSLMHRASRAGTMVVKPLSFEFPDELATHSIAAQFMVGSCVLVSPVVQEGETNVYAYMPRGEWISASQSKRIFSTGTVMDLPAPLNVIPVHFRAGCVIPLQRPEATTQIAREIHGLGALIVLTKEDDGKSPQADESTAQGELFWDDGETADQSVLHVEFRVSNRKLVTLPTILPGAVNNLAKVNASVDFVVIMGLLTSPREVLVNGRVQDHLQYDEQRAALKIFGLTQLTWADPVTMEWQF